MQTDFTLNYSILTAILTQLKLNLSKNQKKTKKLIIVQKSTLNCVTYYVQK